MPENKVILFTYEIKKKIRKNVLKDLPLINMSLQDLFSRAGTSTCECLPFLSKANFSKHFQVPALLSICLMTAFYRKTDAEVD